MVKVEIMSPMGHSIHGTLVNGEGRKKEIVILLHGIFVDQNENGRFPRLAEVLATAGLTSLRIDLPGHGLAELESKQTTVASMASYVLQAQLWAVSKGYEKVHFVPSSFSGALFCLAYPLLDKNSLGKVLFLNPVLDFDDVFVHPAKKEMADIFSSENINVLKSVGAFKPQPHFTMTSAFWIELMNFDVPSIYRGVTVEHTVFHGTADELVDYDRTKNIAATNSNCTFVPIDGGVHAFTQSGHEDVVWGLLQKEI